MHTGEPVVSEEGYHGVGVHRAARIMAAGHGGQVLLSEATAAVLRDEEVEGVGVRDLGVHRLKDLDRPEHVYQLVADGLEPAFPKIRTAGEREAVLPATARHRRSRRRAGRRGRDPGLRLRRRLRGRLVARGVEDNAVGVVDAERPARSTPRRPASTSRTGPRPARARSGSRAAADSVAKIDPQTHRVEQTIDVGDGPQGVAVTAHDVWVANSLDGTVSRVSADTNTRWHAVHGRELADRGRGRRRARSGWRTPATARSRSIDADDGESSERSTSTRPCAGSRSAATRSGSPIRSATRVVRDPGEVDDADRDDRRGQRPERGRLRRRRRSGSPTTSTARCLASMPRAA